MASHQGLGVRSPKPAQERKGPSTTLRTRETSVTPFAPAGHDRKRPPTFWLPGKVGGSFRPAEGHTWCRQSRSEKVTALGSHPGSLARNGRLSYDGPGRAWSVKRASVNDLGPPGTAGSVALPPTKRMPQVLAIQGW